MKVKEVLDLLSINGNGFVGFESAETLSENPKLQTAMLEVDTLKYWQVNDFLDKNVLELKLVPGGIIIVINEGGYYEQRN